MIRSQQYAQASSSSRHVKISLPPIRSAPSIAPPSTLTDEMAIQVQNYWTARGIPEVALFPVIGLPSMGEGVGTLKHSLGFPDMEFNGRPSKSALANYALYSFEISGGKPLNLYEVMIPDIPGMNGRPSTSQIYTRALNRGGIVIDGDHYHWKGGSMGMGETGIFAIHSSDSASSMDFFQFSKVTIDAIQETLAAINNRVMHLA